MADWNWNDPALRAVLSLRAGVVGIDGRCGSGKTTMAAALAARLPCRVVHTDDFYLPPASRRADWQQVPAANMDLERLRREVLLPARAGQPITLRAYRCAAGDYAPPLTLPPVPITIVEGSYSCHPALRDCYDLTMFVTCPPQEQARRLRCREGERAAAFFARWIPLEEGYFARDDVQAHCDYTITTEEST